ncbi:asparaginase [Microcella daejeonensis]|uniref:asparaginase n=1 Tax=Microcella daejeonensis TaxID=2994971 RepID=UPI00226F5BA8|nr:asparaginase [Microcella daejeonensis]WAB83155.1 asparaginase [Microcella daejeonensis]
MPSAPAHAPSPTTPAPLDAAGSVELAVVERSGFIESRHIGAAVVVDADGRVLRAVGDARALVFPRSTLKPVQALAVLGTGARFTDEELVLGTASHCGSPAHLAVVEGMLAADDRDASALQCPAQWPLGARERAARQAAGLGPARITMNCSGKHAAFLRASDALGADAEHYLDAEHPLQRRIVETIEEWTGEPVAHSGLDGCGAPLHATSLVGLARAIARIAGGADAHAARLMAAVQAAPWAIDGPGRANTEAIERLGVLAKIGAEGLVVIGTPSGHAVAVKVLDGSMRATTPVALALLVAEGLVDPAAASEVVAAGREPVLGGETVVGGLRVTAV